MTTATNYKQKIHFDENTIETTVAKRADQVTQWLADNVTELGTGKQIIVGLDVEWKRTSDVSSGSSSRTNNKTAVTSGSSSRTKNKAAILQLCIKNKCLIIQLMYIDYFPTSLKSALMNRNFMLVGLDIKAHVEMLRDYGLHCATTVDIKELANEIWPHFTGEIGLKDFAYGVAKMEIQEPKHIILSDWEARFLSVEQIEFATVNAYASLIIGQMLKDMK